MTMDSWSKKLQSEHIMPRPLRDLDRALQVGLTCRSVEADTLAAARRRLLAERARISSGSPFSSCCRRASRSVSIAVMVAACAVFRQARNPRSERMRGVGTRVIE